MSDSKTTSTLELVVNENMSQIDLSRPEDNNNQSQPSQQQQQANSQSFGLQNLREWPGRIKKSFNAKLDEARSNSESKTQFVLQVLNGYSGTVLWFICFLCTTIVPVFLLFLGLLNLDDCQDRPSLPYLVFAFGFVMTASNLFNLALTFDLPILRNHQILTKDVKNTIASIVNIIFLCVVAFLYILCAYMVYTIAGKSSKAAPSLSEVPAEHRSADEVEVDTPQPIDCSGILYSSTYWFITLTLGLSIIIALASCLFFLYHKYRSATVSGSTPRSQPVNTNPNPTTIFTSNGV